MTNLSNLVLFTLIFYSVEKGALKTISCSSSRNCFKDNALKEINTESEHLLLTLSIFSLKLVRNLAAILGY